MNIHRLLLCLVTIFCFDKGLSSNRKKRTTRATLPRTGSRLACDRGTMNVQCAFGSSIYVTSATFGRTKNDAICQRAGRNENQQMCQSPHALNVTRFACVGKTKCTIDVNEDNLGIALTEDGTLCVDTAKYLRLNYRCVADCKRPEFSSGVTILGSEFALGSSVSVKCRSGYMASSGSSIIESITCHANGSWSGGSITCKDINECSNEGANRCNWHADCINTIGSYTCKCGRGYVGNGFSCHAINNNRSWIPPIRNQSYDIETDSNCGGKIFQTNGALQSPNYPSLYPNSASCQWVLSVPSPKVIEVEFIDFQLEDGVVNSGCTRDFVTIYNGPLRNARNWIATYCGSGRPPNVRSTRNQIRIEFKTDPEASFNGFRALYRSYNPSSYCQNFLSSKYLGVKIVEGFTNETATAGDRVLLACETGFNIVNGSNLERICENDNTWNDASNPCEAVRCGEPKQFKQLGVRLNGSKNDYHYMGSPLHYHCDVGYILVPTPGIKTSIICNQNGRWSNDEDTGSPQCRRITCDITQDLLPPQHAHWKLYNESRAQIPNVALGNRVTFNSYIEYSCIKGYLMMGESQRTCKGINNYWSGRSVICEEDNGVPGLSNFQIAIITSCLSGSVILIVGAALLYCCIVEKKKKSHRLERAHFDRDPRRSGISSYRPIRHYNSNTKNSSFGDSKVPEWAWSPQPQQHDNKAFAPNYLTQQAINQQQQQNYAKRPYMLPSVVKPMPPVWIEQPQVYAGSGMPAIQGNSKHGAYSAGPRLSNRHKDAYSKYQQKFEKPR